MRHIGIFIVCFLCTCCFSSTASAQHCADSPFLLSIDREDLIESQDGSFFLEINTTLYPLGALHFDNGYYYLETSNKDDSEIVFKCPCRGCGRLQTLSLLKKRKMRCSSCRQNVFTCPRYIDDNGLPY